MGLLEDLAALLYPPGCRVCGAPVAGQGSSAGGRLGCAEHALPAQPSGPRCARCAGALPPVLGDGAVCARCRRRPLRLARVVALADYAEDAGARAWVLALKHGGRRDLADPLGACLAARLRAVGWQSPGAPTPVLFVPVPLHVSRRLVRGHDQALELARAVARVAGGRCRRALLRVRATPPQGAPGSVSRRANVAGAFAVPAEERRALAGREVWLVDDVATSGATAETCARALRAAGAARVSLLVVARAGGARVGDPKFRGSGGA